jgi:hypothetical protein
MSAVEEGTAGTVTSLSLRELRVIVDRLLLLGGCPAAAIPTMRDLLIDAEVLGLDGLRLLEGPLDLLAPPVSPPDPPRQIGPHAVLLNGAGALSIHVAAAALDLLVGGARREDVAIVAIENVRAPNLLLALGARAGRYELSISGFCGSAEQPFRIVAADGASSKIGVVDGEVPTMRAVLVATPRPRHQDGIADLVGTTPAADATRRGIPVATKRWRALYERSNGALTPDSALSRHHAGASVLDAAGRIVEDADDDLDVDGSGQAEQP